MMESMPRSASMSMSSASISAGYPVSRLTISSRQASTSGSGCKAGRDRGKALGPEDSGARAVFSQRKAAICPRVLRVPRVSGGIWGSPGIFSSRVARISTRLMESMPRSASMSMSSASISTGYPVSRLTTSRRRVSMPGFSAADAGAEVPAGASIGKRSMPAVRPPPSSVRCRSSVVSGSLTGGETGSETAIPRDASAIRRVCSIIF